MNKTNICQKQSLKVTKIHIYSVLKRMCVCKRKEKNAQRIKESKNLCNVLRTQSQGQKSEPHAFV